jgi:hypothetical protein
MSNAVDAVVFVDVAVVIAEDVFDVDAIIRSISDDCSQPASADGLIAGADDDDGK